MTDYGLTGENREALQKYIKGTYWLMLYSGSGIYSEEYMEKVWERLTDREEILRGAGITDDQLNEIRDNCQKMVDTPLSDLTTPQLKYVMSLILGTEVVVK